MLVAAARQDRQDVAAIPLRLSEVNVCGHRTIASSRHSDSDRDKQSSLLAPLGNSAHISNSIYPVRRSLRNERSDLL